MTEEMPGVANPSVWRSCRRFSSERRAFSAAVRYLLGFSSFSLLLEYERNNSSGVVGRL